MQWSCVGHTTLDVHTCNSFHYQHGLRATGVVFVTKQHCQGAIYRAHTRATYIGAQIPAPERIAHTSKRPM